MVFNYRYIRTVILLAFLLLTGVGCSLISGASTPEQTVNAYYKSIEAGNLDEAANMIAENVKNARGPVGIQKDVTGTAEVIRRNGGLDRIEFSNIKTSNERVELTVTLYYKGNIHHVYEQVVVKENGVWKMGAR